MDLKAFMVLIRRAKKSSFATVLLHNHMMIQCYDIKIDSDMGLHYVLHIPDTVEYIDPFYDGTMLLDINEILATYKEGPTLSKEERAQTETKRGEGVLRLQSEEWGRYHQDAVCCTR